MQRRQKLTTQWNRSLSFKMEWDRLNKPSPPWRSRIRASGFGNWYSGHRTPGQGGKKKRICIHTKRVMGDWWRKETKKDNAKITRKVKINVIPFHRTCNDDGDERTRKEACNQRTQAGPHHSPTLQHSASHQQQEVWPYPHLPLRLNIFYKHTWDKCRIIIITMTIIARKNPCQDRSINKMNLTLDSYFR